MGSNPKIGDLVRLHYAPGRRSVAPYHGQIGRVAIPAGRRGPRNHGVAIAGQIVVVPAGQLTLGSSEGHCT